jgi:hypothetical protein
MRMRSVWQIALGTILALAATPLAFGVGSGGTGLKVYAHAALRLNKGVVVNGITFDPSHAIIVINGEDATGPDDLQPGMVAGVNGKFVPGLDAGDADLIRVTRVVFGKVSGVGSGGTGLKIAGIVANPRGDVVLIGCASASDITVGTTLDVYGYSDGLLGVVDATLIACVAPSDSVELHGVVSAVATGSIVVNGVSIDVSTAKLIDFGGPIADGDVVAVDGTVSAQGIVATSVTLQPDVDSRNGEQATVEDAIGAMISPLVFVVDAFEVDATNASFSGGTAADLVQGRVVRVQGKIVNGILEAQSVIFDDDGAEYSGPDDGKSGSGWDDGKSGGGGDDGKSGSGSDGGTSGSWSDDGKSGSSPDDGKSGSGSDDSPPGQPRKGGGHHSDDGHSDDGGSDDGKPNPNGTHGG